MARPFDLLIVTARTREQARLFERQLDLIDLSTTAERTVVVPDPPAVTAAGEPRAVPANGAGSGTATLLALARGLDVLDVRLPPTPTPEALERCLDGLRVAIIHSGGHARRTPQLSIIGKAFCPVLEGSEVQPLIATIALCLARLTGGLGPGVALACGDVLLRFEEDGLPERPAGAYCWAADAPIQEATHHGVYLSDRRTGLATASLQKASIDTLRAAGLRDNAPIDTGLLFLSVPTLARLLGSCLRGGGSARSRTARCLPKLGGLDLYADICAVLAGSTRSVRFPLGELDGVQMAVVRPPGARFIHLGTGAQLRDYYREVSPGGPILAHSTATERVLGGESSVLLGCSIRGEVHLPRGAWLCGVDLHPGFPALPEGVICLVFPLRDGNAAVAASRGDSGEAAFSVVRAAASEVEQAIRSELRDGEGGGTRLGLAELAQSFDPTAWWRRTLRLEAGARAAGIARELAGPAGRPTREILRPVPAAVRDLLPGELDRLGASLAPIDRARTYRAAALVSGASSALDRAFSCVRQATAAGVADPEPLAWVCAPGSGIALTAPVRVDLAGGWTDTPPQCIELGGAVTNVALDLGGAPPIRARISVLAEPCLEFISRDAPGSLRVTSMAQLRSHANPADILSIHRAACVSAGLGSGRSLPGLLRRLGGGLRIETESSVPIGSGLGTSSILGACLISGLLALQGRRPGVSELCDHVLRLEQRVTTGGGWQDQLGGMLPGFKYLSAAPGNRVPAVRVLDLTPATVASFEQHAVLYYTGVPRLARGVLQRVVQAYLEREERVLRALSRLKGLAREAAASLEGGDWPALGAVLWETWELNKTLEPTATTPEIDVLLERLRPHVWGAKLAGAGGGGFLLALARTPAAAERLRRDARSAGGRQRVYDVQVDRLGIVTKDLPGSRPA